MAAWLIGAVGLRLSGVDSEAVRSAIAFLAADAFLVAAVLRLFRWRATRDPSERHRAIGLIAASVSYPLTAVLVPWTTDGVHPTVPGYVARLLLLLAILPLVATGKPFPGRSWAVGCLVVSIVLRIAGLLLPGHLEEFAPGFVLAAALSLAGAAVTEFRAGMKAARRHEDALALELATAVADLECARQAQRARLHDARSAVDGVLGASAMLTGDQVAVAERETLQHLISLELVRLADVLGLEPAEPVEAFAVREALLPVLRLHRMTSPQLDWSLEDTAAVGRARATATALDNLLRNAAVHAAGAAVRVTAQVRGGSVEIVVEDDGPGIPADERRWVTQPGVRGSNAAAPGSGLGLANVASTMADQDGELAITGGPGGGTRVTLRLPAAARTRIAC